MSGPGLATVGHIDWDSQVKIAGRESHWWCRQRTVARERDLLQFLNISWKSASRMTIKSQRKTCVVIWCFALVNWPSFYSVIWFFCSGKIFQDVKAKKCIGDRIRHSTHLTKKSNPNAPFLKPKCQINTIREPLFSFYIWATLFQPKASLNECPY